eukprot:CAMPEP_0194531570 /NCGR_PEP_ID=MMETSP0253-20130528/68897_1 /TAXON_ID=2966 /ORGANISM="Noctiluca scintillans" /LENGTH=66 /DNA_ID=CAMNT_0039376933 /DNA_START=726 /DNA_END=927 /DNA_ORIENTATION=-
MEEHGHDTSVEAGCATIGVQRSDGGTEVEIMMAWWFITVRNHINEVMGTNMALAPATPPQRPRLAL